MADSELTLTYHPLDIKPWRVVDAATGKVQAQFFEREAAERLIYTKPFSLGGIDAVPPMFRFLFEVFTNG